MKIRKDIAIIIFIIIVLTFISTTPDVENTEKVKEIKEENVKSDLIKINLQKDNLFINKQYKIFIRNGLNKFLKKYRKLFPVIKMIQQILKENSLDPDLVYLSYIESEFTISARSRRNAVGLWQFTSYTGREIGLKIDRFVDERKDIYKSTLAFIKHFTFLYKYYDSVELALAAYNCGVGRLNKAIKEGKSRDFWELSRKGYLPKETSFYVPKFYAIVKWVNENKSNLNFNYGSNLVVAKINNSIYITEILNIKDKNIKEMFYRYNRHIYTYKIPSNTYILLPQEFLWNNKNFYQLNIVYYFIPDIFKLRLNNLLTNDVEKMDIDKKSVFTDYLKISFSAIFNKNIKE